MKIILTLLSLTAFLFSGDLENAYERLNSEIDKISSTLSVEEKISLYYLVMSTHDKIVNGASQEKVESDSFNKVKIQTIGVLSRLQNGNKQITSEQIEKLKTLYTVMTNQIRKDIRKDTLYEKGRSLTYFMIIVILMLIFISFYLLQQLYKIKNQTTAEQFPLVRELEQKNAKLAQQNNLLKSNARIIEENIAKHDNVIKKEKSSLLEDNKTLRTKIGELVKDLDTVYFSHEKFITTQEKEIQNLNKYVHTLKLALTKEESANHHVYLHHTTKQTNN